MDKERFIKKAKEYEYSDEKIDEMIQDYEEDLKNGIDIDPIIFLVDDRGVIQTARAFPVFDSKGNMIRGEIDYYGDD